MKICFDRKETETVIKANIIKKKYSQPPVVSHPSQLPNMAYEEISSGKLFASPHNFLVRNEQLVQKEKSKKVSTEVKKTEEETEDIKRNNKNGNDNREEG